MSNIKIILIIWGIGLIWCAIETYFFTELDPESKEYLKNRENERKNKNLHK